MAEYVTRRRALAVAGVLTTGALAGCTDSPNASADGTDETAESTTPPGTDTTTACRTVVDVVVSAESETRVRNVIDGDYVAFRPVPATGTYNVVVSAARDTVRTAVSESGLSLRSIASFEYCGEPLCDATVKAQVPTQSDATPPSEAFSNAVAAYRAEAAGDTYWTIYFDTDSADTAADALNEAGYDTSGASLFTLAACE
ncbi:hypothetical protein U3A55_08955 [Salarchaeum sp. III]|uniref:hypothetical protein n=1 Tax=Salarchaeum sp. III TaxID=3107927 RepID=UPI002ED94622